jgi:hypothetical protein
MHEIHAKAVGDAEDVVGLKSAEDCGFADPRFQASSLILVLIAGFTDTDKVSAVTRCGFFRVEIIKQFPQIDVVVVRTNNEILVRLETCRIIVRATKLF